MKKYKFQIENGHIYDGNTEIAIVDHVAEIKEEITPALQLVIDAHGGQEMQEAKPKKKRKVKPVKWSDEEGKLRATSEFIDEVTK